MNPPINPPKKELKQITEKKEKELSKFDLIFRSFVSSLAKQYPDLRFELKRAGIDKSPLEYVAERVVLAGLGAFGVSFVYFLITSKTKLGPLTPLLTPLVFIVFGVIIYFYTLNYYRLVIKRRMREIERELLFAGKQMVIELKAGIPLFNAILSVSRGYGEASKEFAKIAEEISMGVPADVALHNSSEINPSKAFRRIVIQIMNALRSGADVGDSLASVLRQISNEKVIEIKRYGQTLNPLAMFYMLFGIIMPSLGITLFILVSSFVSLSIGSVVLLAALLFLIILQFLFLSILESSRPVFSM